MPPGSCPSGASAPWPLKGSCSKYVFAGSSRVARLDASSTYYYHADQQDKARRYYRRFFAVAPKGDFEDLKQQLRDKL